MKNKTNKPGSLAEEQIIDRRATIRNKIELAVCGFCAEEDAPHLKKTYRLKSDALVSVFICLKCLRVHIK